MTGHCEEIFRSTRQSLALMAPADSHAAWTIPNASYRATQYWVDVVFKP